MTAVDDAQVDTIIDTDTPVIASDPFYKKRYFISGATITTLLLAWQFGVRYFEVPSFIAPAPTDVIAVFTAELPLLLKNFWPTLIESMLGFFFGNMIAICLAVAFVHNRILENAFFPLSVFINTIPILAIAPILVLIFGSGLIAKVIIASLICFFPTLVNMVRGLQSVSPQAIELSRILSATQWEVFWKIRIFASLPFLFSALKIASTTCVIGAIVGEWVGASEGLGALILEATFNYRSALLYAAVLLSSAMAVLLFVTVATAERLIIRWKTD